VLLAVAVVIDNLSEGLSIGELVRGKQDQRRPAELILGWTGAIAVAVLGSTLIGCRFLRGLAPEVISFLFALGAGGMSCLTITDLVPKRRNVITRILPLSQLPAASCLGRAHLRKRARDKLLW
jgi:ZIP family zinc transporter